MAKTEQQLKESPVSQYQLKKFFDTVIGNRNNLPNIFTSAGKDLVNVINSIKTKINSLVIDIIGPGGTSMVDEQGIVHLPDYSLMNVIQKSGAVNIITISDYNVSTYINCTDLISQLVINMSNNPCEIVIHFTSHNSSIISGVANWRGVTVNGDFKTYEDTLDFEASNEYEISIRNGIIACGIINN